MAKRSATFREKKAKKKPPEMPSGKDAPTTVSAAELAAILADPPFSDRWLRELADQGYLVKAGRGTYELAASVKGYVRYVLETEVRQASEPTGSREQFEAERARKLKLENDTREALLIETQDVLAAIDHIFGEMRTALSGIAAKATDDVSLRRRIDDAIDGILTDISRRSDEAGAALQAGRDPCETDTTYDA